jgi:hypothetical protein
LGERGKDGIELRLCLGKVQSSKFKVQGSRFKVFNVG